MTKQMAGKMKFSERKQGLVTDKFKVGYGKRSFFRMSICWQNQEGY